MTLRTKSLAIVLASMACLILVLHLAGRYIILESCAQIERMAAADGVERVLRILQDRQDGLKVMAKDYAAWDDTYRFVATHDPEYVEANLVEATFQNARLNLVVILDHAGREAIARAYDEARGVFTPLPAGLAEYLGGEGSLAGHAEVTSEKGGLLRLADGRLMLVVSHPITTSNNRGPIRGALIMGRYLDAKTVGQIAAISRSRVELLPADAPAPRRGEEKEAVASGEVHVELGSPDEKSISAHLTLPDVAGRPIALLRVSQPRSTWQPARSAIHYTLVSLLIAGVAAGLATIFFWDRVFLSRLMRLREQLVHLGAAGRLHARISADGQDELSKVAAEVNDMLAALEQSETRYRELFDGVSDLVFTHDPQGRFGTVNAAFAKTFGYGVEEVAGRQVAELWGGEIKKPFETRYLEPLLRTGQSFGVLSLPAKGGGRHYIEYHSTLIKSGGRPPYISGVGRDVTDRVRADRERRKFQAQLQRGKRMEALGVLAGGVAHDFNNILQAISGHVQLMMNEPAPAARYGDYLERIDRSVASGAKLVQRLLAFGRKTEPQMQPLDLNYELRQAVALLERTIPKMITIALELAADLPVISGDPAQLERVFLNLANNARDAMPEGGRLTLRTAVYHHLRPRPGGLMNLPLGPYVTLEVRDTGQGIPREALEHVFEPFFTTKGAGGGTGLGLATVYGIVKSHRGHVTCASRAGRGTVFTIYLPVASAPEPIAEGGAPAVEDGLGGDELLLLVDDEEAILAATREALERYGYRVLAAATGEMALAIYGRQKGKIALVLLDLNMPGMGGIKCLGRLLQLDPRARVVVASGYVDEAARAEAKAAGAKEIIGKPYRFVELLSKIRRCLDAA